MLGELRSSLRTWLHLELTQRSRATLRSSGPSGLSLGGAALNGADAKRLRLHQNCLRVLLANALVDANVLPRLDTPREVFSHSIPHQFLPRLLVMIDR